MRWTVLMALRPGGISSMTLTSKSPYAVIANVRGMGVAVMTNTWGAGLALAHSLLFAGRPQIDVVHR